MKKTKFNHIALLLAVLLLLSVCLPVSLRAEAADETVFRQDFESVTTADLGTPDGNDADGYYAVGEVSVVAGGADGSAYCLKVSGAEHGNGKWLNNLAPNTDYVMTFSAKIANWGGNAYPNVGVNGYDGNKYQAIDTFTEQWAKYSLTFKTGASAADACIYTWIFGSGAVELYLDNIVVCKASHVHSYTAVVTTPATCGTDGLMTCTCACGDTYTEVIPATGDHRYENGICVNCGAEETVVGGLELWDFEHNNLASLGTPDGSDSDGYYAEGKVSIVPGGAGGSKYCLRVSGADSGNGLWLGGLQPETGYTVSFYAKIGNWGGNAYPNAGVNSYDGDKYQAIDTFTESWTKYSVTFKTGKDVTGARFYTWIFGSGAVDFYLDNVTIAKASHVHEYAAAVTTPATCGQSGLMTYTCACGDTYTEVIPATGNHSFANGVCTECGAKEISGTGLELWDFEHNSLAALGTPDGGDADPYYAVGTLAIVAGGANGTSYALKLTGAECGNGLTVANLKPSTQYELTFWAKKANCGDTAFPNVGVNSFDGDKYVAVDQFTEAWKQYSVSFATGKTDTSARIYTWIFGSGNGSLFLDEVKLTEKGEAQEMTASRFGELWTFEHNSVAKLGTPDGNDADGYYAIGEPKIVSGGQNSSYCLRISGGEHGNGQWISGLKPGTQYTLVFWAKATGLGGSAFPNFGVNGYAGNAYQAIDSFTGSWAKYVITFKTGANNTSACVYSWIFGSGNAALYIDNVTLSEGITDKPTPKSDNGGTANTQSGGKTELTGWDFEHNSLASLGTADGNDADGYYAVGDLSIVSGGADGTQYALKISGAEHGNGQWITGLKPDTEYTLIFWAKIDNWGGDAYPSIGVNGFDGGSFVSADNFTNTWSKQTLTFKTGKSSTSACIYTWIFGSGAVDFFIDQVELVEGAIASEQPTESVVQDVPKEAGVPPLKNAEAQSFVFAQSAETGMSKAVLPLAAVSAVLLAGLCFFLALLLRRKNKQ